MSTPFSNLITPDPHLNATLNQGHAVAALLAKAGFTTVLYANQVGQYPSYLIPETPQHDDNPFADNSQTLQALGVPLDLPIYLVIECKELGERFFDIGQFVHILQYPDPINALAMFVAILGIGNPTSKVLQILSRLTGVPVAIKAAIALA